MKIDKNLLKLRRCCKCRSGDTYITNSGTPLWYHCVCKDDDCTTWLCHKCYTKAKSHSPGGYIDTIKSVMNIRMDNVGINSDKGMYIISQAVVAKTLGIEDLNIKNDNFQFYIDMEHPIYKKIDVKCSSVWHRRGIGMWTYAVNRKIDCDTYFLLGFSPDNKGIEDIRIVPNEDWISDLVTITISRNSLKTSKYDQFITDSSPYNDTYQSLILYIGDRKYFGIGGIKNWLIKKREV